MTSFWTVFAYELRRRRLALGVAAVAGFVPLFLAMIYAGDQASAAELRAVLALLSAVILGPLLTFLLGASSLGSELADGKLGFWFSRPIPLLSIWAGRLTGATTVGAGASLLVLLPTLILAGGPASLVQQAALAEKPWPLIAILSLLFSAVLGHLLTVASRDRSVWSFLDFFVVVGIILLSGLGWKIYYLARDVDIPEYLGLTEGLGFQGPLIPIILLALLLGSALLLTRGRLDVRRGHRLAAVAVAAVVVPLALWNQYRTLNPPAPDSRQVLQVQRISTSPDGRWCSLAGPVEERRRGTPAFLMSADGDTSLFLTRAPWLLPVFSRNGRTAAWVEATLDGPMLYTADLREPTPKPRRIAYLGLGWPGDLALSPSGRRVAIFTGGTIEVLDLQPPRSIGAYENMPKENLQYFFVDEHRIRIFTGPSGRMRLAEGTEILEIDVREQLLRRTGLLENVMKTNRIVFESNGDRVLIASSGEFPELSLRDGRTGAKLQDLGPGPKTFFPFGLFLRDAGFAVFGATENCSTPLYRFDAGGERIGQTEFAGCGWVQHLGQTARGSLIVSHPSKLEEEVTWHLVEVDLETGARREVARNLQIPAQIGTYGTTGRFAWRSPLSLPGDRRDLLTLSSDGAVVRLDTEDGTQTILAGPKPGSANG